MISDNQMSSMLHAITHHDTSQPLNLYNQIIVLDSMVKARDKKIERLERLLDVYKKYALKKATHTKDMIAPNDEETISIVFVGRINKSLFENKNFNVGCCLLYQMSNKILHFIASPNYRKKMEELIP